MLILLTCFVLSETASVHNIPSYIRSHPNWKLLDRGEDCGHSVSDRIIGGTKASLGQYPWLVRLGYASEPDDEEPDEYACGGVIISELYVLSAAHCSTEALTKTLISVRVGEYSTTTDPDCVNGVCAPPVQDIDVEENICHPNYTKENGHHHDICVIRLAKPIKFNDFVAPICMPSYDVVQNSEIENTIMEVAGWGRTKTDQNSDVLLTVKVPGISNYICSLRYSGLIEIVDTQVCAGGELGKDSCTGDSGGPLMKQFSVNSPPRYFVLGIVSFGLERCGETEMPGVYTLVFKYWQWILDNIAK